MASYKVSYKVLRQQGDEMKAAAKLVDSYAEKVTQISGKLGSDEMLSEVRGNLQKLRTQLGESRTVLNTAGELLIKSVESYGGAEIRQVKKVDGMKAHNRDFYKNPVVVASAGGAAGGAAAVAGSAGTVAAPAVQAVPTVQAAPTVQVAPTVQAAPAVQTAPAVQAAPAAQAAPVVQPAPAVEPAPPATSSPAGTVIAAGAGVIGGAAAATGAIFGGAHLKKKLGEKDAEASGAAPEEDNLDAQLQAALERVRQLNEEEKIEG